MRFFLSVICLLFPALVLAEDLLIIANPQVSASSISTQDLAAIYLIKKTAWPDGLSIVPVNREAASDVREQFSEIVLEHSPRELAEYWNRLRFQGKQPPLVQTSDQAVIGFVRNVPGAIGYIFADQRPAGVKVLVRLP